MSLIYSGNKPDQVLVESDHYVKLFLRRFENKRRLHDNYHLVEIAVKALILLLFSGFSQELFQ